MPSPSAFDVIFLVTAAAFNLLIAGIFIADKMQRPKLLRAFGVTWLFLAIPLGVAFIHSLLARRELWVIACFSGVFFYMLVEWLLDYVWKIEFRKKLSQHIPYIVLEYVALFGLIAIAFSIDRVGGYVVSIAFWVLMACLIYAYAGRKTGSPGTAWPGIQSHSSAESTRERMTTPGIQEKLDELTQKWWFYLILLLLFFLPAYTSRGYDPRQSVALVGLVLSAPLINAFPDLMPIAKIIPVLLILGLFASGNRMRRAFNVYVAALYLALALFQTTTITDTFGLVVLSGNLALVLSVALVWIWEAFAEKNDFEPGQHPGWTWWVAPLAVLSLFEPVDPATMSPDFSPLRLLTNEAGLTFCMTTPVVLAVLTLFHPAVNRAVLRVTSFAGMLFGAVNVIVWFGVESWGWWMGVLHIPLVVISVYAFWLAQVKVQEGSRGTATALPAG